MATGSDRVLPPSSNTLPEMNMGWTGVGVVGWFRFVGTLGLLPPGGVEPGFGCASAVCANTATPTNNHALKREEFRTITPSSTLEFQAQTQKGAIYPLQMVRLSCPNFCKNLFPPGSKEPPMPGM
jgi:hypothetical protein